MPEISWKWSDRGTDEVLRRKRVERLQHFRARLDNSLSTALRRQSQDQRYQFNAVVRGILFLVRLLARWDQHKVEMALRYYKSAGIQQLKAMHALD